jgi:hypothetical protein
MTWNFGDGIVADEGDDHWEVDEEKVGDEV